MSMEIVNGYVCRDCTDVERAKKGEDPAKPDNVAAKDGSTGVSAIGDEPFGVNRPLANGDRGTVLNFLA
jgi:hypothetical protein